MKTIDVLTKEVDMDIIMHINHYLHKYVGYALVNASCFMTNLGMPLAFVKCKLKFRNSRDFTVSLIYLIPLILFNWNVINSEIIFNLLYLNIQV